MNEEKAQQKNYFSTKLNHVRKSLEAVVFLNENDHLSSAVIIAHRTYGMLFSFLDEIKGQNEEMTAYWNIVIKNKLESLHEDRAVLADAEGKGMQNELGMSPGQFDDIINRLDRNLRIIQKELNFIYPQVSRWDWVKKYRPQILIGLISAACLIMLFYAIQWFQFRNNGLQGEYFEDMDFKKVFATRKDGSIDFNWTVQAPFKNFKKTQYAVRWTGGLNVKKQGDYVLTTFSDDGVRLWIDDKLLIDDWNVHPVKRNSREIFFSNTGRHNIKLEYFQNEGGAVVGLYWKTPGSFFRRIIGRKYLLP